MVSPHIDGPALVVTKPVFDIISTNCPDCCVSDSFFAEHGRGNIRQVISQTYI